MITVKILGGLGNQMFQYAAGKCLASRHGTELVLDTSWFGNQAEIDTPRFYELDQCNITARSTNTAQKTVAMTRPFARRFTRYILRRPWPYSETEPIFEPRFSEAQDNTVLSGWFQNEQYFMSIRAVLLDEFTPSYRLPKKVQENLSRIKKSNGSVSLHVRRGDYVSNKHARAFHGLAGIDYYKAAVDHIAESYNASLDIYVFSDDLDWCRENLKFPKHTLYFVDGSTKSFDDIWLMSHCTHNIVANSSFSWWGAWLNKNESKIIIAPKQWFQDASAETDIVPSSWVRL